MLVQRGDDSGANVRERCHVKNDPPVGKLLEQQLVFDRADAVADPVCVETLEGAAYRLGAGHFARVRNRSEPLVSHERENLRELLGWKMRLFSAETDAGDPPLLVLRGPANELEPVFDRGATRDVRSEQHLDAVQLAGLLSAVAIPGEEVIPGDTPPGALDGREDALDVDRSVPLRLGGVVDDHLTEVVSGLQR